MILETNDCTSLVKLQFFLLCTKLLCVKSISVKASAKSVCLKAFCVLVSVCKGVCVKASV